MELYITPAITCILLILGGFWLKNYLPSYFNEKGKLLAQKKDIEEITKKIEGVKIEFTTTTEILKSNLQRLVNLETSHRNEERNCIIDFYTKYNQWLYALLEINYGAYNIGNVKDLNDKRIHLEKFYGETGIAQAKIQLLVKNEEIVSLSSNLYLLILHFKAWFDDKLLRLQHNLDNQIYHNEDLFILVKDLERNKDQIMKLSNELRDMKNNQKELISFFYDNKVAEHKKIISTELQFTSKVKSYLTN